MSCVLRVSAPGVAVVADSLSLKPYRVDGDTVHYDVSAADFDQLAEQIEDAITFLRQYQAEIGTLMALPSASGWLDFGVSNRHLPAQFGRLSPELVCLAGKLGLGLELSLYAVQDEKGAEALPAAAADALAGAAEPQAVRRGGQGCGPGLWRIAGVGKRSIILAIHRHLPHRRPGPVGFWLRGFVSRLSSRRARRIVEAGQEPAKR